MDEQLTYLSIIVGALLAFELPCQIQFIFAVVALVAWYRAKCRAWDRVEEGARNG